MSFEALHYHLGSIHQGAGNEDEKFKFMNRISQIIDQQAAGSRHDVAGG